MRTKTLTRNHILQAGPALFRPKWIYSFGLKRQQASLCVFKCALLFATRLKVAEPSLLNGGQCLVDSSRYCGVVGFQDRRVICGLPEIPFGHGVLVVRGQTQPAT